MGKRKKIEEPIATELAQFKREFADSLTSNTKWLQDAIKQIMAYSGKHVRPLLVLLTAKAFGGITSQTINSAVMIELLHTSTLIHDDVVDETKQRRGVPSLNAIFDNRVSVLVGDYILSSALIRSTLTNNLRIISIISRIGRELAEGEIKQLETAEESIFSESGYFDVIRKKTAALLAACTEIGAISAGASDEMVEYSRRLGENMGICFQLKDDIFDYYHDGNIGKPTGNDIREGKITLPLLFALRKEEERGSTYYRDMIIRKDFTDENIEELIEFAKSMGGIAYTERKMQEYRRNSLDILGHIPDSPARQSLVDLADYIIERKK